jgi:hypothetical protein
MALVGYRGFFKQTVSLWVGSIAMTYKRWMFDPNAPPVNADKPWIELHITDLTARLAAGDCIEDVAIYLQRRRWEILQMMKVLNLKAKP